MSTRSVLVVAHTGRREAVRSAQLVIERLSGAGIGVRVLEGEAADIGCAGVEVMPGTPAAAEGAEVVMVLGGDGTLLRAADLARPAGTPLLGVNLGHVGFLAEAEREDLTATVERVVTRRYDVEERMTIDVMVRRNGTVTGTTWALNEATVEKAERERMLEVVAEIDGRPLSNWGCDGVVCATPTGSTAYAFSAGGPIVWPEVEAMLVVPISAHALFARPIVVSPRSTLAIEVLPGTPRAVLWCDGRRTLDLPPGARVEVRRGADPVRLARLHLTPFTDRLVTKFGLPVTGWRGRVRQNAVSNEDTPRVPGGEVTQGAPEGRGEAGQMAGPGASGQVSGDGAAGAVDGAAAATPVCDETPPSAGEAGRGQER